MNNTSSSQDREVAAAMSHAGETSTHFAALQSIIEDLDQKIDELRREKTEAEEKVSELESKIVDLQTSTNSVLSV